MKKTILSTLILILSVSAIAQKKIKKEGNYYAFLNSVEIGDNKISNIDSILHVFEDETENFVKNIFMLQYYLHGISFVDLSHLKNENVVKQNDGDYIVFKRIKLMNNPKAKFQQIKLTEEIKRILSALIEHQKPVENYLIPIVVKSGLPYDKLYLHIKNKCNLINLKLKEISKKLGFDNFNLTTYVSRHTVAMKLRESNVPIEVIQQVFGHSAISTTQIYLDSFGTEAINKAVENL